MKKVEVKAEIVKMLSRLEASLEKAQGKEEEIERIFFKYLESSISLSEKEKLHSSFFDEGAIAKEKSDPDAKIIKELKEKFESNKTDDYLSFVELKEGYKEFLESSFVAKYSRLILMIRKRMENIIIDNVETYFKLQLLDHDPAKELTPREINIMSVRFLGELAGTNVETFEKTYEKQISLEARRGTRPPYDIYTVKSRMLVLSETYFSSREDIFSQKAILERQWELAKKIFKDLSESYSQLCKVAEDGELSRLKISIDQIVASLENYDVNYSLNQQVTSMTNWLVCLTISMIALMVLSLVVSSVDLLHSFGIL